MNALESTVEDVDKIKMGREWRTLASGHSEKVTAICEPWGFLSYEGEGGAHGKTTLPSTPGIL